MHVYLLRHNPTGKYKQEASLTFHTFDGASMWTDVKAAKGMKTRVLKQKRFRSFPDLEWIDLKEEDLEIVKMNVVENELDNSLQNKSTHPNITDTGWVTEHLPRDTVRLTRHIRSVFDKLVWVNLEIQETLVKNDEPVFLVEIRSFQHSLKYLAWVDEGETREEVLNSTMTNCLQHAHNIFWHLGDTASSFASYLTSVKTSDNS